MRTLEVELADGSIVEFDISVNEEALDYSGAAERVRTRLEELADGSFSSMLSLITVLHERAVSALDDASELEISFSLGVNAKGDLKIVSGEASASMSMKTVWRHG